jgi:hypothetical protein
MTRKRTSDEYYTKEWMLDLPVVNNWMLSRIAGPFMDTNAGEGAWLVKILGIKLANGIDHKTALQQLYGVELQEDSAQICRDRLLMGNESLRHIVEQNIVCADALRYHYRFDGTDPYETEQDRHFGDLFIIE